jgi:hypothetical protein
MAFECLHYRGGTSSRLGGLPSKQSPQPLRLRVSEILKLSSRQLGLAQVESDSIGQSVKFRLLQIMRSCHSLALSPSMAPKEVHRPLRCRTLHNDALRIIGSVD